MEVAKQIAEFAADSKFDNIPSKAIEMTKIAVRDCLGVALAGSQEESAKICAEIARQENAREEATLFGQGFKSSVLQAAFANGTAAHALDFDHSFTLMGQPSAPIIPAVLSLGESLGASGRQLLEAYVTGFEAVAKLVFSVRNATQDGWHGPRILGVFGAGVGCAKLLGLTAGQIEMALGITVSMAGGVAANFGTMTKPLHVGLAARDGLLAAKLASSGFTANAKAIEAGAGFYEMFYQGSPVDNRPLEELGQSYAMETDGIRVKPYPCGGLAHPTIDATLELRAQHGITADMVEAIDVDVTKHTYSRIAFRVPQTGIQGKFSMPYLLSRAIIDGKLPINAFTDEAVRDRKILDFAERIQMRFDPNLKAGSPGGRPCRVTIRLKNGRSYVREAEHAKGSPEVPMAEEELKAKFRECARQAIDERSADEALGYLARLETLEDIRPLCKLLAG